jgi:hypothetical protein
MAKRNSWSVRARQVIAEVLSSLPPGASEKAVRAALRYAYPFGERENWPYKMWCQEQARALKRLFPKKPKPIDTNIRLAMDLPRPYFLRVVCGWCDGKIDGGCLQCVGAWERMHALTDTEDWRRWRAAMGSDPVAVIACADWCDENGYGDVAALLRSHAAYDPRGKSCG